MKKSNVNDKGDKQSLKSRRLYLVDCCEWCLDNVCVVMLDKNDHPFKQLFCLCDFRELRAFRVDIEQRKKAEELLKLELTNKSVKDKNYSEELRQMLEITPEESVMDSPRCVKPTQVCQYYSDYFD